MTTTIWSGLAVGAVYALVAIGYNVVTDEYVNMVQAGVIDPVKVTRSAVENAASIAAMILTTEALITDLPEKEPAGGGAPAMPQY